MVSDNVACAVSQLEPWLMPDFNYLNNLFINKKLPKVILLHGVNGIGKKSLAAKIASLILGEKDHPDLNIVGENQTKITIEDIRDIISQSEQTAYLADHKVFMLFNAESLNIAASNALLKVLESESSNNYFILTTDNYYKLLPTIISRCFKIHIKINDYALIREWLAANNINNKSEQEFLLEISNFAPLRAIDLYKNGYLDKLSQTKIILQNLNNNNLLNAQKSLGNIFAYTSTDSKTDSKFNLPMFLNILNYVLVKNQVINLNINININIKIIKTLDLIKKYKKLIGNNIAIDASNAVFTILYSII